MSEETTIIHVPHEEGSDGESPEVQATNEHDVEVAKTQADASVAQAAILAESQVRQEEIHSETVTQVAERETNTRIAALEARIEEMSQWRNQQQQPPQSDILMIPTSEDSPSSEEKSSEEPKREEPKPKPRKSGLRPLFAQAPKKRS